MDKETLIRTLALLALEANRKGKQQVALNAQMYAKMLDKGEVSPARFTGILLWAEGRMASITAPEWEQTFGNAGSVTE